MSNLTDIEVLERKLEIKEQYVSLLLQEIKDLQQGHGEKPAENNIAGG